jgi:hypothetical protein
LQRSVSKRLFRAIFQEGKKRKRPWRFNHSSLYLDFLAGNQNYQCTAWGNPTRNLFGWQRPCYLLVDEGYAASFRELMEETDWDKYGVGNNSKCANCMAHCGFEPTAINDTFAHPLKAMRVSLRGPRLDGPMALDPSQKNLTSSKGDNSSQKEFPIPITVEQTTSTPTTSSSNLTRSDS